MPSFAATSGLNMLPVWTVCTKTWTSQPAEDQAPRTEPDSTSKLYILISAALSAFESTKSYKLKPVM